MGDFALSADDVEIEANSLEEVCCEVCGAWQERAKYGADGHHFLRRGERWRLMFDLLEMLFSTAECYLRKVKGLLL
jgi:hypothetical protein